MIEALLCTVSQVFSSDVISFLRSAKDYAKVDEFGSGSSNYKKIVGSEDTYNNYVTKCAGVLYMLDTILDFSGIFLL